MKITINLELVHVADLDPANDDRTVALATFFVTQKIRKHLSEGRDAVYASVVRDAVANLMEMGVI